MEEKVAIVGYSQTGYSLDSDASREILTYEAAVGALSCAGISRDEIDTVVTANNDYMDGRTISNMRLVEPSGAWLKDESKVEMDGAFALLYAVMRILSGDHEVALVIGVSQPSVFPRYVPGIMMLDPTFDRERGLLNEVSAAALQARSYMETYGISEEEIARVAVKNLRNAALNPLAVRSMPAVTVDDILSSRPLYSPINELTSSALADGACAVVVASAEKAKKITDKPVWIEGVGFSHDSYLTERSLSKLSSLEEAAKRAYSMAGVTKPPDDIDLAEVHENFAHEELMAYEALGLCEEGKGAELLTSGRTGIDGDLPVNPSGGALSVNVPCAAGLARVIEAVMQIRCEAGSHQVKGIKRALAHGQTGPCAQENVVFVLGGE